MLKITYSTPCNIQGHIKFKKCPAYYGIGFYDDIDNTRWDVYAIIGGVVLARPVDDNPMYSTAGIFDYVATWKPYTYEPLTRGH